MSGHLVEQIKAKPVHRTGPAPADAGSLSWSREQVANGIARLHALSRRGLWGLLLFLVLSAVALAISQGEISIAAQAEIRDIFGTLPSVAMLNLVLAVSWVSALVMIVGRRDADGKPAYNWCNIGLPAAFYPLYVFCDPTGTYFPAVFLAGLVLLLLEHGFVVSYAKKAIRTETARLQHLPD